MKTRKSIVVMLLIVILSVMSSTSVLAAPIAKELPPAVQPFWENTSSVSPTLSFTGTTANVGGVVRGFSGTTRITATVTLARRNANGSFATVKTWSDLSANGATLAFSNTHTVTRGHTYRVTISANVTRNGTTEAVSNWFDRVLS